VNLNDELVRGLPGELLIFGLLSFGDAYDAAMQTVSAMLKVEIARIRGSIRFPSLTEAYDFQFGFIEVFYNRQRNQTGLSHRTPAE
jgi:hypothetical protein